MKMHKNQRTTSRMVPLPPLVCVLTGTTGICHTCADGKQGKTDHHLPRECQPDFLPLKFWVGGVNLHLGVRGKATHVDADKQGTTVGRVCFPQLLYVCQEKLPVKPTDTSSTQNRGPMPREEPLLQAGPTHTPQAGWALLFLQS